MFDQPALEALLRTNLKRYPNAELRGNVEVTDVAERSDGRIRVTYVDRTDDSEHAVDTNYVLGCDGANSIVRAHIGASMRDMRFEQRWLVVDAATDVELDQWDGVHQVCDPARAGTYMRIGPNRYRWEFRLLTGESADNFRTLAALKPLLAPWISRLDDDKLELIRVTEYTFRAQIADRWRRGNILLLGDAAHLTPPFVGQGLGAGVRDAMNLVWKLAGVIAGDLPKTALDSYEQERRPHARQMIRLALAVGWAMTAGGEFGNLMRRLVVTRMKFVPGLRRKVIDSRTPALSGSPFVRTSWTPRQLAGKLCPNPVLADGRRLDSILGGGFALISTSPPPDTLRSALEERGTAVHIAVPGCEIADWLHRSHATSAIVRPDRTVMCAGRDMRKICDLLPTFRSDSRIRSNV
jgi:3-(3-hydroxy-phenyl)propionate hydroxylase